MLSAGFPKNAPSRIAELELPIMQAHLFINRMKVSTGKFL
jgi:hypothetical protein